MVAPTLKFLGTGGGRFTTIYQARSTGGCLLKAGGQIHIDPGPGALLRARDEREDLTQTRAVLVSHAHPDHYTDAEYAVEAMTRGRTVKRGVFVGSKSVVDGTDSHDSVLSRYHRESPEQLIAVAPGDHFKVAGVVGRATYSKHSDDSTVGFRFTTDEGIIGYIADSQLDDELIKAHRGSRLLVVPATRPRGKRIPWHLSADDVITLLKAVRPEAAVLNHFGLKMVRAGPDQEAAWIEKQSGVRTIAGLDGMSVRMADKVEVTPPAAAAPGPAPPWPDEVPE